MATLKVSPRARALSAALRDAREKQGMSSRQLAYRLSMDQSYLSRIETGKRVPKLETTAMILATLRTPPKERERILDLARHASDPNWLTVGIPGIPQQLAGAWECERAASTITTWHPCVITGLLQTTEYARDIALANDLEQHEVESRVVVKIARRGILTKRDPVQFKALIAEAALRESIGGADVMIEQLRYLISIGQRANVTLNVVPRNMGWHPGLVGPFMLYEFAGSAPVVHFEHHSSGAFDQDADDIKGYRKAISKISGFAMNPCDSVSLIARIIVDEWGYDGNGMPVD